MKTLRIILKIILILIGLFILGLFLMLGAGICNSLGIADGFVQIIEHIDFLHLIG